MKKEKILSFATLLFILLAVFYFLSNINNVKNINIMNNRYNTFDYKIYIENGNTRSIPMHIEARIERKNGTLVKKINAVINNEKTAYNVIETDITDIYNPDIHNVIPITSIPGYRIENGHYVDIARQNTRSITIEKKWTNGERVRKDSVQVRIKGGTSQSSVYHSVIQEVTLKASERWTKVIQVPRYDYLYYSVEEVPVNNFTTSYSEPTTNNFIITNTFTPQKHTLGVLMGVEGGNKDLLPREIEVKVKDAWSTDFSRIEKMRLNSEKTEYYAEITGYDVTKDGTPSHIDTRIDYEIPGYRKVQGKYQYIVNNIQKTVRVEKENGKDNIPFKIYLKQNGVKLENTVRIVKAGSTETFSVPETKFADGSRYTYTLEHEETPTLPEGYSIVKVSDELIKIKYTSPNINVNKEFTVTNGDKTNLPQTVSVTINNNKGLAPKTVNATLKADKSAYVLSQSLPKNDTRGDVVTYSYVLNTNIPGYNKTNEGYEFVVSNGAMTFEKQWVNGETVRPESIQFKIKRGYLSGQSMATYTEFGHEIVTLRASEGWRKVVTDLPRTDINGRYYAYIPEELPVPNFTPKYTWPNNIIITNTYVVPKENKKFVVNVNGGNKNVLPNTVEVTIKNDKGIAEKVVSATLNANKTAYEVTQNLDTTKLNGERINYTVSPKTDIPNYTKSDNAYTYVSSKKTFEKVIPKENGKPIEVKVILTRNGSKVLPEKAVTVNTGETARFTDLDKTDSNGIDYNYGVIIEPSNNVLPEGYAIDNATGKVTYTSPKVAVTKDITVNGGNKNALPNEIDVRIENNRGLSNVNKKARLNTGKTAYVVNESLDKTTTSADEITYTVKPVTEITNYTKNDSGYTYVSPKKNFEKVVPKENGKPIPVKVILTRNGSKVLPEKSVIVNTGETARFTDLDKTDSNGVDYNYGVIIEPTDNSRLPEGYSIDNQTGKVVYTSPRMNITVEKNWVNGETVRPETITAKLKRKINTDNAYTFVQDITVRKDNNWRLVVSNLEKTDANGNDYTYIVEEETNVNGFNPSYSGLTITNTYVITKENKKLTVNVNGGNKETLPQNIQVTIKNDKGLAEKVVNATLNRDKTAYEVTENLDTTKPNGERINYTAVPKGDIPNYTKDERGGYTYVSPKAPVSIVVPKENGKPIEVKAVLTRNGVKVEPEKVVTVNTGETANFGNLDSTDANGNPYRYGIEIKPSENGLPEGYSIQNGKIIYTSPKITVNKNITVTDGNKEVLPNEIDVRIENNRGLSNINKKARLNTGKTAYVVNESLDKTTTSADEITYTVKPVTEITNYTKNDLGYTYVSPKTTFEKVVPKENGKSIEVKVILTRNGEKVSPEKSVIVNTGETARFTDLDKTDINGNVYNYDIKVEPSNNRLPEGYTVDNQTGKVTYTSPKITVNKEITVNGGDKSRLPNEIDVRIENNRGLSSINKKARLNQGKTAYVVNESLDKTTTSADEITYTVVPVTDIANYTKTNESYTYVSPQGEFRNKILVNGGNKNVLPNQIDVKIKNDKNQPERTVKANLKADKSGYEITENLPQTTNTGEHISYSIEPLTQITNYVVESGNYRYVTPRINITIEKNWVNGETVRPETITAKLKRKIASDNAYTFVQDITVRKENNWRLVVSNLEKTDENGNDYTYIVEEETNVNGFNPSYSGLTITNTYVITKENKKLTVNVNGGNKETLPQNIQVTIKNDKGLAEKVVNATLNRDKTAYEVTENLDTTKPNGERINYTAVPKGDIPNYTKDERGGYTYVSPKAPVSIVVPKENGKPIEVKAVLTRNGVKVEPEKVVTVNTGETANFGNLDSTDANGNPYRYGIEIKPSENGLPEGYSIQNGKVVYTSPKITFEKVVPKENGKSIPVKVKLTRNGVELQGKEVIVNTGETARFTDLDKTDANGNLYTYDIKVEATDNGNLPEGYTVDKTTGKVTYTSPKIVVTKDITVTGGNKELLPTSIKAIVSNDRGLEEKEVDATLNQDKTAYVVNESLDKTTSSAEKITYTVMPKTDITNYTKTADTYTYVSPKVNVTVEKNWVNGETVIPETITAKLKRKIASDNTYTFVQDVTVRKDNNWQLVVANLDSTDANGNDYTYIVEEETNVDNFNAGYNGLIITNTYVSPKKQLDLRVDVNGGDKNTLPQTIDVEIIDNSDSKNPQVVKTETIRLNQDKTAYVGNIIVNTTKPNGQEIPYIVKPKTSLEDLGFRKDQTGNYIYTPKLNTVTGKITYINGRTLWKDLDVKLYKNGNEVVGTTKKITRDELINNKFIASNEEKAIKVVSYENQKETEDDGTRNTYEVRITSEVPGFRKEVLKEDKITNIILRYQNEVRDLTYTPTFTGGNANERPELTVILKKKEKTVENPNNETFVEEERKVSVNGNAVTFNQKVVKNYDGTDVEYKFEVTVKPNSNYRLINGETEGEFKLEYVSPKISFTGNVKWVNGENINKPNVTLGLVRNGVRLEDKYNKVVSTQNTSEVNVTWNDLDKTDKEGNVYTYTIVEDTVLENYTKRYENGNTKVVNTYVSPKINFEKTVKQNGGKNIPVKVTLTRNGVNVTPEKTVTVNTGETARFTDLDKTDANGNPYTYDGVITATLPEGYSWKKDKDGNIVVEYTSPKINLTVEKMWEGGDTLIPENIEVKLKRRLKQVNGNTNPNNTNTYVDFENNTYQVEKNNNWTKEISNLDKTDENANEYEYIVEEITNIENFTNTVNNFRITNIYNVPNKNYPFEMPVNGGDKTKLPKVINVVIENKANGENKGSHTLTLNEDKTAYTGNINLPSTDERGNRVNYGIKEVEEIPGYVKDNQGGYTFVPKKIEVNKNISVNPELINKMKSDGVKNIEINVKRNGEVIKTITVPLTDFDSNGNYKVVMPDLDETDQNGNKYNYDLDIINLVGYDVEKKTDNQGNTVINISKKVEIFNKEVTVTTNGGKVRPTVAVELLKNGNKVKETKITNNKVVFENLEKNDKLGNKFEYIVKIKNEEDIRNRFSYEVKLIDSINSEKAVVVLNYIVKKIDVPFKLVYQGANGEEKPKVSIRLLRDGKPVGDIVTLNGEYEYVFKGLDETDQNGNIYEYKVEIVGEIPGYEVTMSPSGKTIILTKKMEKGKFLPYAGTEKNVGVSTLLILMIGYGLKAFKAQRKINTVTNIRGIKR